MACQTAGPPPPRRHPAAPPHEARALPQRSDQPNFYRLRHTAGTPVRVAILLPLSNPSAETRALADALEKAAELALFESGNRRHHHAA